MVSEKDETSEDSGFSLLQHYDLLRSTDDITTRFTKNLRDKTCRFCNKKSPDVSFDTIPHIIPQLFGRNNLTSNFECDNCNRQFQKCESDTSNMIQHYLGLLRIKTKNGIPVFQSNKSSTEESTFLRSVNNSIKLDFGTNLKDFEFDEENKTLTVKFRTKHFKPFSVYKTFLKMGISLLSDEEISGNSHYLEFLNSDEPIKNGMQYWTAHRYMLKSKMHVQPKVNLYKAKTTINGNRVYPEYMILINFSNIIFQFFLPVSSKNINEFDKANQLRIELFPSFLLEDLTRLRAIEMYNLDLSETNKIWITDKVVFHYNRAIMG